MRKERGQEAFERAMLVIHKARQRRDPIKDTEVVRMVACQMGVKYDTVKRYLVQHDLWDMIQQAGGIEALISELDYWADIAMSEASGGGFSMKKNPAFKRARKIRTISRYKLPRVTKSESEDK